MVPTMALAAAVGVTQIAVLGRVSSTLRFRSVWVAVGFGLFALAPLTGLLEWGWVQFLAKSWGVSDAVSWAGWTVDPFLEEVVRFASLCVLMMVVPSVRRLWSYTDLVVLGAAVGAGHRLAEQLWRFAGYGHLGAGFRLDDGWIAAGGLAGLVVVPAPKVIVGSWLPDSVTPMPIGRLQPTVVVNDLLVLGALTGLAAALVMKASTGSLRAPWAKVVGVGLVIWAGFAHADLNSLIWGEEWPFGLWVPGRVFGNLKWLWPLVFLAMAWALDSTSRDEQREKQRITGPLPEWLILISIVIRRPFPAYQVVSDFVRLRRMARNDAYESEQINGLVSNLASELSWCATAGRRTQFEYWRSVQKRSNDRRLWLQTALSLLLMAPALVFFVLGGNPNVRSAFESSVAFTLTQVYVGSLTGVSFFALVLLRERARRIPPEYAESNAADRSRFVILGTLVAASMLVLTRSVGESTDANVLNLHALSALLGLIFVVAFAMLIVGLVFYSIPVLIPAGLTVASGVSVGAQATSAQLIYMGLAGMIGSTTLGVLNDKELANPIPGIESIVSQVKDAARGDPHGDGGRRLENVEREIEELEEELAILSANRHRIAGSRKKIEALRKRIFRLRKDAQRRRKGETHGRSGFGPR